MAPKIKVSQSTCECDDPDGAADGHPEDTVVDRGVRVVPRPPQKLDPCDKSFLCIINFNSHHEKIGFRLQIQPFPLQS